jgi:hypothetical protein
MGNQEVTIERGGFGHQKRDLHASLKASFYTPCQTEPRL